MMNCPFCKQEIQEDSDLCPCCGKSLEMVCSACHRVVSEFGYPQYKLCLECSDPPCDQQSDQNNHEDEYPDDCDNYPDEEGQEEDNQDDEVESRPVYVGGDICGFVIYE
jgi:hypothetical protein